MAYSMTGYGRSEQIIDDYSISVEIKSVNHRYFDFSIRAPRFCAFLEDKVKARVQQSISRGKVDVYLNVKINALDSEEFVINQPLAKSCADALKTLAEKYDIIDDVSVSSMTQFKDIFEIEHKAIDEDELLCKLGTVLDEALKRFVEARQREGEKLIADMLMRNRNVSEKLEQICVLAPEAVREYRENLEIRIRELIGEAAIDESRLLTETAIFADKISITEEIIRLKSHIQEFEFITSQNEPIGRKLDFLMQEMNRETNTIGSKTNNLQITKQVVSIKAELEKMREQLQNIE